MFKLITTLILASFLGIIYTSDSDPITLHNLSITTTEQAVEALAEIRREEVLPLVLFDYIDKESLFGEPEHILQVPENLDEAVTVDGKMIKGTKFYSSISQTLIFFCPRGNSKNECMAPKEFKKGERLLCDKEATPNVKEETLQAPCGFGKTGTPFSVLYKICPSEKPYEYTAPGAPFHGLCYDKKKQKVLYTIHQITSPKLLTSKLLYREQNMSYVYMHVPELKTAHHEEIKNALFSESDPSFAKKRPMYDVQKLVPSEDLSFALWKKTAYLLLNVELQHKVLFPLWNKIHELFKKQAILMHDYNIEYYVRTGVFDIAPTSEDDDQIYNMWVKTIHTMPTKGQVSRGIAILMNNFIDSETDDSGKDSKLRQTKIKTYCKVNLCSDTLVKEFESVKGRLQCCPITKDIGTLFGIQNTSGVDLPALRILDLTLDQI